MGGDYSRKRFNKNQRYSGVLMQQGRVQLDSDWNEGVAISDRRWRAETLDVIGRCGVPAETPGGFKIGIDVSGDLTIGRGRIYVDGFQVENFGAAPLEFDRILEEQRGTNALAFADQDEYPDADDLDPPEGRHLVFVDVWRREVTHLEDPDVVEQAVGVDTTTRWQTAWRVDLLTNVGEDVTCETADADIPGWLDRKRPSAGRLSSAEATIAGEEGPCAIPPTGGYRGLENRLYRVEIHNGGAAGTATFKWSRYNGTIASAVTAIPALDTLKVVRTERDSVLRFNSGDWVEITDDWRELAGLPGFMRQVAVIDDATRTITLTEDLPAGAFPTNPQNLTYADRHTRVRRWDQHGRVKDVDGNPLVNLDAPGAAGVIPVPGAGTPVVIEDGVEITFDLDSVIGSEYRSADFWCIATRTADASVEELDLAPPRGLHHHYCRLALVDHDGTTFVGTPIDCRDEFPPLTDLGPGCCTVVVEPGESIQAAIDSLPEAGGCICLKTGLHFIEETVVIDRSRIVLHGESPGTVVRRSNGVPLVAVSDPENRPVSDVTIEGIRFELDAKERPSPWSGLMMRMTESHLAEVVGENAETGEPADPETDFLELGAGAILSLHRCRRVDLNRCVVLAMGENRLAGVLLSEVKDVTVRRSVIGNVAFGVWAGGAQQRGSYAVSVLDCELAGQRGREFPMGAFGVNLESADGPCRVEHNRIGRFGVGIAIGRENAGGGLESNATGSTVVSNLIERASRWQGKTGGLFGIDVGADFCLVRDNLLESRAAAFNGIRTTGRHSRVEGNVVVAERVETGFDEVPVGIMVGMEGEEKRLLGLDSVVRDNRVIGVQDAIRIANSDGVQALDNRIESERTELRNGIVLSGSDNCRVAGNLVANAVTGITAAGASLGNQIFDNQIRDGDFGITANSQFGLEVSRNRVRVMRSAGFFGGHLWGTTSLAENRFVGCGTVGIGDIGGVGIGALYVFGELVVESCEVIDTGVAPDGSQVKNAAYGIASLFTFACRVQGNVVTCTNPLARDPKLPDKALRLMGLLEYQVADDLVLGAPAHVLDNKLTGPSSESLVDILGWVISEALALRFERILFSNNFVWQFGGPKNGTVWLTGGRASLIGNHIKNTTGAPSFNLNDVPTSYLGNHTMGGVAGTANVKPAVFTDFNFNL